MQQIIWQCLQLVLLLTRGSMICRGETLTALTPSLRKRSLQQESDSKRLNSSIVATGVGEWTQTNAPELNWLYLASCGSGQYVYAVAGGDTDVVYMTNDFGKTWFLTGASSRSYTGVSTSQSGQYVYLTLVYNLNDENSTTLFVSNNYGKSFSGLSSLPTDEYFQQVACSDSGAVVYVLGMSTEIYVSLDYGQTFTPSAGLQEESWFQIVCGSSGANATAVSGYDGGVYTSSDYGESWNRADLDNDSNHYTSVQMHTDGSIIMVVDSLVPGGVYVSYNYGKSFDQLSTAPDIAVSDLSASSDMQYILTLFYTYVNSTYVTSNGGDVWNLTYYSNDTDKTFFSMTSSSNGQLTVACDYGGGLYLYEPSCPEGYVHMGFDAHADPQGTNLCYMCEDGYYGELTDDSQEVVCLPCATGTYSSDSPVYGSDSCIECDYPFTTVDDASDKEEQCHVVELDVPHEAQWILYSVGFLLFVAIILLSTGDHAMEGEKSVRLAISLVLIFPFFDLCTDFAYLVISPFYHISLFILCVICFIHPIFFFFAKIYKLRALPTSLRFIWWLGYATTGSQPNVATGDNSESNESSQDDQIGTMDGAEEVSGDYFPHPTITFPDTFYTLKTSRFTLLFSLDMHDSLCSVFFEAITWMVAISLQVFTVLFLPLFLLAWLVVGMFLQLTQLLTLSSVWNSWFIIWTGSDRFCDTGLGGVDTEELNYGILTHFLLESVPGIALQAVNNTLLKSWTEDSVAIMSLSMSIIVCLSVLYKYLYHSTIHAQPRDMKNIPIDRSIRVKIMLFSIDWGVLDAQLPPYTKEIRCAPDLAQFRYSIKEDANEEVQKENDVTLNISSNLEESLLSDAHLSSEVAGGEQRGHENACSLVKGGAVTSPARALSPESSVSSGFHSNANSWFVTNGMIEKLLSILDDNNHENEGCDVVNESKLDRLLTLACVPSDLRQDATLQSLDASIVIELFAENQSLTSFIDEMSKFEISRVTSSKIFMYLKNAVKSMQ